MILPALVAASPTPTKPWPDMPIELREAWRRYDLLKVTIMQKDIDRCTDLGLVQPRVFVPADPDRGHDHWLMESKFEAVQMGADTIFVTQMGIEAFRCAQKPKRTRTPSARNK